MIAAFLEIHHDIEQGDGLGTSLIQLLKVPGQNPTTFCVDEAYFI